MEVQIAIVVEQLWMQLVHLPYSLLHPPVLDRFPDKDSVVKRAQIHRRFHSGLGLKLFRRLLEAL